MTDDDLMTFGKHKGRHMIDVPADYLLWILGEPWIVKWPNVLDYIQQREESLIEELNQNEIL